MRRVLVLLVCVAFAACGADEPADDAAQYLDPRSDAVLAVDLDYDSASWQQVKRLYARAVGSGVLEDEAPAPPTLDGALAALSSYAGLSFSDDVRPLLGGIDAWVAAGHPVEKVEPAGAKVVPLKVQRTGT